MLNTERIQALRDEASVNYMVTSNKKKLTIDTTSRVREIAVDQSVWYRTPGLSESLQPSWQGPYEVTRALGGLTYAIDIEGKTKYSTSALSWCG